jgi:hypothetical protein
VAAADVSVGATGKALGLEEVDESVLLQAEELEELLRSAIPSGAKQVR